MLQTKWIVAGFLLLSAFSCQRSKTATDGGAAKNPSQTSGPDTGPRTPTPFATQTPFTGLPTPYQPTVQPYPSAVPPTTGPTTKLLVPVTAFSNMENGWQVTNPGFRAFLKDSSGRIFIAAPMGIEAVAKGQRLDAGQNSAYPRLMLNISSQFVNQAVINQMQEGGSYQGSLSICMAADQKASLDQSTCRNLRSNVEGAYDQNGVVSKSNGRNHQIIDHPVNYTLRQGSVAITNYNGSSDQIGGEGSSQAITLSVLHAVQSAFAPGKAFKDFQSPLVLDLNGDADFDLIDVWSKTKKVLFDIEGDGIATQTGWVGPRDGLLAIDRDGNGMIDDGRELLSEWSYGYDVENKARKRFQHGFDALAQYDSNEDGVIDEKDPAFKYFVVWRDLNSDGKSQKNELMTLKQAKIKSISLAYEKNMKNNEYVVKNGNEVRLISTYQTIDGKTRRMADVWFKQRRNPNDEIVLK